MPSNLPPASLSSEGRASIIGFLENAAKRGIGDGFDYARDLPGFIADETPRTVPFAAAKGIARQACRRWARGDAPQNLPGFDAFWGGACGPYLDGIGENPGPGSVAPPFSGGQCNDGYSVTWSAQNGDGTTSGATVLARGPIGGVRYIEIGNQFNYELFCSRLNISQPNCGSINDGTPAWRRLSGGSVADQPGTISITGIVPCGLDNCGDPPPEYDPAPIPPGLPTLPPSAPIDIPGIGPIDIGVDFNPDGTISITAPDLGIDINTGDPSSPVGEGDPTLPPGDVGSPGTPSDTGAGGENEGEAPEGQVLVGLRLDVLAFPTERSLQQGGVFRAACYVFMGVSGLLDLDPAGLNLSTTQFVFAEQPNLTSWQVRANRGYDIRVTPYYRQP